MASAVCPALMAKMMSQRGRIGRRDLIDFITVIFWLNVGGHKTLSCNTKYLTDKGNEIFVVFTKFHMKIFPLMGGIPIF